MDITTRKSDHLLKIKDLQTFAIFIGLAIVLRLFSFFPTVINHDESTYIVISDYLMNGSVYFIDVVDTKPIGIFLIYAGLQKLVGSSIFLLRVMTALWLAITAFVLYKAKFSFGGKRNEAIATGIIYLIVNSVFTYYGISPNTETFFNLFTALGLLFMLKGGSHWRFLLAGLCLGWGLVIKYVVAFDALAFGLFLLWDNIRSKTQFFKALSRGVVMAIGSCIPLSFVLIYYAQLGYLDEFLFYTFEVSSRYPESVPFVQHLKFLGDFFLRYLPIALLFIYVLVSKATDLRLKRLGLLWSALVLLAILLPGKWYGHYYIQFMLPFSFVAGSFFAFPATQFPKPLSTLLRPRVGFTILSLLIMLNMYQQKKDCLDKPDHPKTISKYLEGKLEKEDRIYTSVSHQVLYHLLDKESPTKYVHPSLFWEQKHIRALEVNVEEELAKITEPPPRYIIWRTDRKDDRLDSFLYKNYLLVKTVGKDLVYERR